MNSDYKKLTLLVALALTTGALTGKHAAAAMTGPAALKPCSSVTMDPVTYVTLGKSSVIQLDAPAARMVIGGQPSSRASRPVPVSKEGAAPAAGAPVAAAPAQAQGKNDNDGVADVDITLLSPRELFFLGRKTGSMNVVLQGNDGRCHVKDIIVSIDPDALQARVRELMPDEGDVRVKGAENAIVLIGTVNDAGKLADIMSLANSYGEGRRVVNLLRVKAPQQVMLEVKIAEVSKTLLDRLGSSLGITRSINGTAYSLVSSFLSGGNGLLQALNAGRTSIGVDGQKDDGLVRVLAEPNIMAISGQQASFLSGGKIFIPVSQSNAVGAATITLEEKEFGIGVKFTPTVLNGSRVNLKMVSEVSDLSQTGSPFTTVGGVTAVLPSFTVRRADTTVQLNDGQSFAIAGLIKNNVTGTIKRFPGLGEIPVLGALFGSTEFQNDRTELLFVITPHLVKPLAEAPALPTDNHIVPSRADVYFNGKLEGGSAPAPAAEPAQPMQQPAQPMPQSMPMSEAAPAPMSELMSSPMPAEQASGTEAK